MNTNYISPISFVRTPFRWRFLPFVFMLIGSLFLISDATGQTTYTWSGTSGDPWTTSTNWTPTRTTPNPTDILQFNSGSSITITSVPTQTVGRFLVSDNTIVTLEAASAITLTDGNGAGTDLDIQSGSTLTLATNVKIKLASTATASIGGTLTINAGGTFETDNPSVVSTVLNAGLIVNSGSLICTNISRLVFNSGSTYNHSQDGGAIPPATWNQASTCKITGIIGLVPTSGGGQSFGNLIYDCASMSAGNKLMPSSGLSVAGYFQVLNTGSGVLQMNQTPLNVAGNCTISDDFAVGSSTTSRILNIAGDLTINGGLLSLSSGTGIGTLNVTGDFYHTGGTITETSTGSGLIAFNKTSSQTFTDGGTVSNTINFTVKNGSTLQMATPTTTVTGSGTFLMEAGSTLGVTSVDGISTSGATGNIRTTTRTYTAGSSLIYNGTGSQAVGNGLTSTNKANLTINNPGNTVTLGAATSITGALTVMAGSTLDLSSFALGSPSSVVLECGASASSSITNTSGALTLGGNVTVNDVAGAGTEGPTISCPVTLGATRTFTIADDGSSAADLTVTGIVSGGFGITKEGPGKMMLSAANAYTGTTTINAGTLELNTADERIANASTMTLGGGTFSTGATTGYSETVSTLNLIDNSTINLGTGTHTLTFANSSGIGWTANKVLTITGWTGTIESAGTGTAGKIQVGVGGLTSTQLGQILFSGYTQGAVITPSGELVPKANIFYSTASSSPDTPGNWNSKRDGSGISAIASDFTSPGTYFIIQGSGNGGTSPHTMITSSSWILDGENSKLIIESGATLIASSAITVGTNMIFQIDNGGTYKHDNAGAWSTTIFQGTESFGASSTIEINATATTLPTNSTYGNLIINLTSDPGADVSFLGNLTSVLGNLDIQNTQSRQVSLSTAASPSVTIAGNFSVSGATSEFVFANGTGSPTVTINGSVTVSGGTLNLCSTGSSGSGVLNVKGNFAHTGGVITAPGSGTLNAININGTAIQTIESIGFSNPNTISVNIAPTGSGQVQIASTKSFVVIPSAALTVSNTSSTTELVINGTLATGSPYVNNGATIVNGTLQLNDSGSASGNAPVYGASSALVYNTTSTPYNVGTEWTGNSTTAGSGVPQNVTIQNSNDVLMPNSDRGLAGNLLISSGGLTLNASSGNLFVAGNWSNAGSFTSNGRTVSFNGGAAQTIGGTSSTTFANLTIANTSGGVSLASPETVTGTLTLTSGILSTDATNILSVTNTSTSAVSAGSSSKFIKGPFTWSLGTGTYLFPVGKSTSNYFPFKLAVSAASSPFVTVEAFDTDAGGGATYDASLISISHTEYWKATLNSGTFTGKVSLTRVAALSGQDIIGQSTSQGGAYTAIGGTPSSPSIINSDDINGLSYFVMATGTRKCPVSSAVSPSGDQTVCQNVTTSLLTTTITSGSGIGIPTYQYQWYYNTTNSNTVAGATQISGATSQTYTPLSGAPEAGTVRYYFCVGYAADNTCAQTNATQYLASNPVKVTVNALPVCSITGTDPVCPSSVFVYSAPGGLSAYAWSISGNGSISGGATSQTVTAIASSGCNTSYILTLTVTDANGCTSVCTKSVTVQDITAPVIGSLPAPTTINCPATPTFATATATDACGSTITMIFTDVTTNGACAGSYSVTRTWTATDACGNSSTLSQTINVQDIVAPVIGALPAPTTINCPATPAFATATATDACGSAFTLTFTDVTTNGACAGSYGVTRTWTATDACGNSSTLSQTINVQDITAPVIGALPAPSTINCPATPAFATATATDACGSAFTLTFTDVTTNGACAGSYSVTRTWTATDGCSNVSTASQTINVQDITAPVIGALPAPSTINCPATPSFAVASATDVCGSAFTLTFADVTTNGICAGAYSVTRTWTATDDCNNVSTASQTINVQDITAPVIASLPATSTINCPTTPVFATATASDQCGSAFTLTFADVTTNGACAGSYTVTRTWTATDACNNISTAAQTIIVQDITAPVIASLPSSVTINCPATPSFATATASDE